jgi:hypothetical protein
MAVSDGKVLMIESLGQEMAMTDVADALKIGILLG